MRRYKRDKKSKELLEVIFSITMMIIFAVSIVLPFAGIFKFMLGFHNFDTAQNIEYVNAKNLLWSCHQNMSQNLLYDETTLEGKTVDESELSVYYRKGVKQIFEGMIMCCVGFTLFGAVILGSFIEGVNKEHEKNRRKNGTRTKS